MRWARGVGEPGKCVSSLVWRCRPAQQTAHAASVGAPGAVIFSNGKGQSGTPVSLRRDPYHVSVHPEGEGFALRSKSNVLTVYDRDLQVEFETDLARAPELAANRDRLGLPESETHRALRCIALTPDRGRYLFTHVDEAWCIDRNGKRLWGLRMPAKEPTRIRIGGASFGMRVSRDCGH